MENIKNENDLNITQGRLNIRMNAGYDSPGLRYAGPPSLRLRRKEGLEVFFFCPLCNEVGERADGRSLVGVSRLRPVYAMPSFRDRELQLPITLFQLLQNNPITFFCTKN